MAYAPPQKCLVLTGDAGTKNWADPRDYRFWGNREYARASGTQWVRFWVNWDIMQPRPVGSVSESWDQLNGRPDVPGQPPEPKVPELVVSPATTNTEYIPYLKKLDRQIRAANDDGLLVILTILHTYPVWTNGTNGQPEASTGKPANQRFPSMKSDSPYGWFLSHLVARYNQWSSPSNGQAPNPYGPHLTTKPGEPTTAYRPAFGNPSGAFVTALEVVNEPNHLGWPQKGAEKKAADAMETGYFYTRFFYDNSPPDGKGVFSWPWILGPGTLDRGAALPGAENYLPFTTATLTELGRRGFGAPLRLLPYVGWSHHNYGDIKNNVFYNDSRTRKVKQELVKGSWKGGTDRNVWLTEGGYDMTGDIPGTNPPRQEDFAALPPAEQAQRLVDQQSLVAHAINEMSRYNRATSSSEVPLFSQYQVHQIRDPNGGSFESGMTENFLFREYNAFAGDPAFGDPVGPGRPRPIAVRWTSLPDELS